MKKTKIEIEVRNSRIEDIDGILEVARSAYSAWPSNTLANERNYRLQIEAFPDGQFVAIHEGRVVGYCSSLIVHLGENAPWFAHGEITGWGTFSTHNPTGDTLYGADIAVHSDFQGRGASKKLYQARKHVIRRFNLRQMLAGGRIPGYSEHTGKMSAKEYVDAVVAGRLKDPALNAHLKAGYTVKSVHYGYIEDQESLGYATHLVMLNPSFRQGKKFVSAQQISRTVRKCRVCAIQYEMQKISGWADFCEQVEYFIDTADAYDSHIVVFPELFIAQMLCTFPRDLTFLAMVRKLADLHADYVQFFTQMAKSRDLFIVAGSVPVLQEDGRIKNVAHLFSPAGQYFTQDKLHLTPAEKEHWGMSAGDGLAVFDTIYGRIGILICYDIEFPELSRILVNAGVDMIVVPFATDERKAYQRVRFCAQARSVENIIYTVLSGNVGTLPRSPAMGINFGQAAILTPSDFAFPLYSIAAEGVVNTQTVVVSDLDIGALEIEREIGNVRPLLDRRTDLYNLVSHVKVQRIRVM